jgi:aspartyl-tRNA(Asn)/glutamyl-tRNA(Gln) amidotransferase subunit C
VAKLARLDIEEEQVERFADQIGTILDYVDTLKEVDATGIAATSHAINRTNAFREDRVGTHLDPQSALSNAPEQHGGAFIVPRIIEQAGNR